MITASRWQSCNIRRPDSRTHCGVSLLEMVRGTGLEPARPCGHWLLRPARLPVPPAPLYISISSIVSLGSTFLGCLSNHSRRMADGYFAVGVDVPLGKDDVFYSCLSELLFPEGEAIHFATEYRSNASAEWGSGYSCQQIGRRSCMERVS